MPAHFANPTELHDHVGAQLGTSDWQLIDQNRINDFAGAGRPACVAEHVVLCSS